MIKNSINVKNVYIILTLIFFSVGIFLYSIAINQYQIKVSSRATSTTFNQCNATQSNLPCGSCNISDFTINSNGNGVANVGCELRARATDTSLFRNYEVKDQSWFWCNGNGTQACTQANANELKGNVNDRTTKLADFTLSASSLELTNNNMTWNFNIPNWTNCGRVQVDVQIAAPGVNVAGLTKSFGENCETTPTNTPEPTSPPATPVPPTLTLPPPTPTPTVTNTPTASPTATATPTPTNSPTPTPSNTPTPTITRTPTPTRTNTPVPTWTQVPTWTPAATFTPEPTYTRTPTPVKDLSIGEQKPGFNPIYVILIPVVGLIIGLLL